MKTIYIILIISIILLSCISSSIGILFTQQSIKTTQISKINESLSPTIAPTLAPTITPTIAPTLAPTITPTIVPTLAPTISPTSQFDTILITRKPQTTRPPLTESPIMKTMRDTRRAQLNSTKQNPTSLNTSFWNCLDKNFNQINNPSIILVGGVNGHIGSEAAKLCNEQKPECANKDCLAQSDDAKTIESETGYQQQKKKEQEDLAKAMQAVKWDFSNLQIDLSGLNFAM